MSTYRPTAEQQAVIDACVSGHNLVVEAAAGAGKTSTLRLAAQQMRGRILYVAYNRAAANEAKASFPRHVRCSTVHGLAMGAVGRQFAARLAAPRQSDTEAARQLGITNPVPLGTSLMLTPANIARLARGAIQKFCHSAADEIGPEHLTALPGMPTAGEIGRWHREVPKLRLAGNHAAAVELMAQWETHMTARQDLAALVLPVARKAWADLRNPRGYKIRFEHDHYLKMWQLTHPELPYDVVMLDEAQDSNPCRSSIVTRQRSQRIAIGDGCQQLYGWQGAVDALATWPADARLYLTQSWRFGEAVAQEANKWLSIIGTKLRVRGNPTLPTVVGPLDEPDAVLCRSNAGAVARMLQALEVGQRAALVGGAAGIVRLAEAAGELKAGRPTQHPELFTFQTWEQVQEHAEEESGADLRVFVSLIDKYGPEKIVTALSQAVPENTADVVISTGHKAKGREWDRVQVHDDFHEPKKDDNGVAHVDRAEAMLAYVAVTRARQALDRGGLAWIDQYSAPATVAGAA